MTAHADAEERIIALDGMGGDRAPDAVVEAAATITRSTRIRLLLCGDGPRLDGLLQRAGADRSRIDLLHAPDAVPMGEDPQQAVQRVRSSLAVAAAAVAAGRADALVTAGNTGATLLHAARAIPRIAGIRRTALAAVYPTLPRPHNADPFALLLDVGANVRSRAEDLVHFAHMGVAYSAAISKVARPTVGLLNIGTEASKGDETLRAAHALLADSPRIDFRGNVEGKDISLGAVDVIVCPGVLGNVALKLLESMGDVVLTLGEDVFRRRLSWRAGRWLLRGGIARLMNLVDYTSYGGAPILGFERIVIKAHGRSDARALENAIKVAAKAVRADVCGRIAAGVAAFARSREAAAP
ncbi:MAG: phosphate acyltransferase PlsX [Deltaproteobacteria bacterium]|nr:MAG: phosphate acyltransferase PlsX [Deltaproteobacteria bacterium]